MEEFKGDKRTKAYKKWKAKRDAELKKLNVGDKIADITKATGIDKVVKWVFGEDCGCEERQQKVNLAVRGMFGRRDVNELTEQEYKYIVSTIDSPKITPEQQRKLRAIHERIFMVTHKSTCDSCSFVPTIYRPLINLIKAYDSAL